LNDAPCRVLQKEKEDHTIHRDVTELDIRYHDLPKSTNKRNKPTLELKISNTITTLSPNTDAHPDQAKRRRFENMCRTTVEFGGNTSEKKGKTEQFAPEIEKEINTKPLNGRERRRRLC
jgi:hypothetical protein